MSPDKTLEVCQKYSAARRILNSLVSVSSGDETLRLMFDILHNLSTLFQGFSPTLFWKLGCIHTVPYSSCAGTKTIPNGASVHA